MIEGIPLTGGEWTLTGIVFLIVIMILSGMLIPRFFYKAIQAERDHWRDTAITNTSTMSTQAEAIKAYAESAEFSKKVMEAIQQNAGGTT
jgi:uncharacterized membrane-anchored protein YhcB (DUF1043 family)